MRVPAVFTTIFGRLRGLVARTACAPAAILKRNRLIGQLGRLDDAMLRDIGLTRQDVASAAAEPLFRDPSLSLCRSAGERRAAQRAAALERQAFAVLMRAWSDERRAA